MASPDFSQVKAVYFDLDDTLVSYWEASKKALLQSFAEWGPQGVPKEEMVVLWAKAFEKFYKNFKETPWYPIYLVSGNRTRTEQMRLTLLELGLDDPIMAQHLSDAYAKYRNDNLELFPEAEQVLILVEQKYPLGLITNGPADVQRQEIESVGVEGFFKQILIEGEMGFGKPDPRVFEKAETFLNLQPNQILFVGNSYTQDVKSAHDRGWRTAWVRRPTDVPPSRGPNGMPEEQPEDSPTPDLTITDLREILPYL